MKASVLVVDDDPKIVDVVCAALKGAGYAAVHAETADAALALIKSKQVDLALLDIDLPGLNGLKLLEVLKEDPKTASLPVIMITAKASESYKLKGLGGGADDYLIKPFSLKELLARVEALLRRVQRSGQVVNVLELGGIRIDFDRRKITTPKGSVELTPSEFELLARLMRRSGYVQSYGEIIEALSGSVKAMTSGNLYVLINSLRKKLGPQGAAIETVYGIGYKFSEPET